MGCLKDEKRSKYRSGVSPGDLFHSYDRVPIIKKYTDELFSEKEKI